MKTAHDLDEMLERHDAKMNGREPDKGRVWRFTEEETTERRKRVSQLIDDLYAYHEIAKMLGVSQNTITDDAKAIGKAVGRNAPGSMRAGPKGRQRKAELDAIAKAYGAGATTAEIAERLNLQPGTIRARLHELGLFKPGKKAELLPLVVADYQRGLGTSELAERHELSRSTVRAWLKEANVFEEIRVVGNRVRTDMVTANSLTEMSRFADLILRQDISEVDLTEEEARAWEEACRNISRSVSKVRRTMKGNR